MIGVTGDDINQLGWASVCTTVGCRRPSNLSAQFYDEQGRCSTDTVCCHECVTGEGHSAACDATAAAAEDSEDSDGPPPWAGFSDELELDMTTERLVQVGQPFELTEDGATQFSGELRNQSSS